MHPANINYSTERYFDYPDGTKIIYWASIGLRDDSVYDNPNDAYGNYKNSGVAIVNNNKAMIHINCPNKYKIPSGNTLEKHIHYRVAFPNNPILSDVKTLFINCTNI